VNKDRLPTLEDKNFMSNEFDATKRQNPQEFFVESITKDRNKRITRQIVKRANVGYQFFTNRP
jgi:hypothetical protein